MKPLLNEAKHPKLNKYKTNEKKIKIIRWSREHSMQAILQIFNESIRVYI